MPNATGLIKFFESCRLEAYLDSRGYPTIGWGKKDSTVHLGNGCTQEQADAWLARDVATATRMAASDLGAAWLSLDAVRQAALISMSYQLGGAGLAGFRRMLDAVEVKNWAEAKKQAILSDWAKETPKRAEIEAEMLLTGEWPVGIPS